MSRAHPVPAAAQLADQGLVAGISAAIGYGIGTTLAWFVCGLTVRRPSATVRRRAWLVLAVAARSPGS